MAENPVEIGAITEALNNKTDTDGGNVQTIFGAGIFNSGNVATVVETGNESYSDGSSKWYRLWSDGWLEQGGSGPTAIQNGGTVTFLKNFSYYPYVGIRAAGMGTKSDGTDGHTPFTGIKNVTAAQFEWSCGGWMNTGILDGTNGYINFRWYANGQSA